jgi:hypothetical protein
MPAATPLSATILNRPMSPVRCTCVPPHSSRLLPMSSTRTSSPYFSPNSIIAPLFCASSSGSTAPARGVGQDLGIDQGLDLRICASVTGALWAKSKRVRSALTSEPFCCTCAPSTSRRALCIRWVALWLRTVRARRSALTAGHDRVAHLDLAFDDAALVAVHRGLHLDRVLDHHAGDAALRSSPVSPTWPPLSA